MLTVHAYSSWLFSLCWPYLLNLASYYYVDLFLLLGPLLVTPRWERYSTGWQVEMHRTVTIVLLLLLSLLLLLLLSLSLEHKRKGSMSNTDTTKWGLSFISNIFKLVSAVNTVSRSLFCPWNFVDISSTMLLL